jgi:hypothetical protein
LFEEFSLMVQVRWLTDKMNFCPTVELRTVIMHMFYLFVYLQFI